jgi:two-component system sensor histidine kinase DesK
MMILVSVDALSTAALEQKNSALAAAQGEVRQLAVAAERERIGRDLHDLLGRTLTLIALKAELAERVGINDFERARKEMQDIGDAAREVLAEVRSAVAGITDASLHREAEEAKRVLATAGIECILQGDFTSASPGSSAVCAMALREAVTNVVRHSGARTCTISVDESGKELRLSVVDDGQSSGLYRGGGIDGTKARLEAAGGEFSVVGGSQGTRVSVVLPRAPHS